MPAEAPAQLPLSESQYDAILVDKVLHCMTPPEIDQFLSWSRTALKKGGKIYIVTTSPTNVAFSDKLFPVYREKSEKGEVYAGYFENVTPYLSEIFFEKYPQKFSKHSNQTTLFTRDDLKKQLECHGFKIQETYALRLEGDGQGNYSWHSVKDEDSDCVGAIAIKKEKTDS